MCREPAAHMRLETHQRSHRCARYIHDLAAIQHAECRRIRGLARQLLQVSAGDVFDIHRFEIGGADFEDFRPQQKIAPTAGDVAKLLAGCRLPAAAVMSWLCGYTSFGVQPPARLLRTQ